MSGQPFDIAPFALPAVPRGELRFEEARDITAARVAFSTAAPARLGLEYLQRSWPRVRVEAQRERENPARAGMGGLEVSAETFPRKPVTRPRPRPD